MRTSGKGTLADTRRGFRDWKYRFFRFISILRQFERWFE